jgi:hypothetical protein
VLAFILPVSFSASDYVIPDRPRAGWGLASFVNSSLSARTPADSSLGQELSSACTHSIFLQFDQIRYATEFVYPTGSCSAPERTAARRS